MTFETKLVGAPFQLESVDIAKADDGSELGTFEGLASTFGNTDLVGDIIKPGAFKASLRQGAKAVKMLWQHDSHQPPIGIWDGIRETDKGLRVKGSLFLEMDLARNVHVAMKRGALDSLSIGFRIPEGGAEVRRNGVREITEIELKEISIVNFPANPKARVERVKALGTINNIREFEAVARDVFGLTGHQAKRLASGGWPALSGERDVHDGGCAELVASIEHAAKMMEGATR